MFAPLKTWRQWHRESNLNERRVAVCSALAASAVPALVMARGHRVDSVSEIPLVLARSVEGIEKTKDAIAVLKKVGAYDDVDRAAQSKKLRTGIGKIRNRRYVMRRGPLVVHNGNTNLEHAMRNIPGVDLANVERLNLLQLAPGGHLGRFVIFTEGAFNRLDEIFGTYSSKSAQKTSFTLPRSQVTNADIARVINSDEIQSVVRPRRSGRTATCRKQNPLTNIGAMVRLNPYAKAVRRDAILSSAGKRKTPAARGMPTAARPVKRTRSDKRTLHKALTHANPGSSEQPGALFLQPFNRLLANK
jgi:large subunit ribosomal protein L4e